MSAQTIQIELTPEAKAVLAGFDTMPPRILARMRDAMDTANELVVGKISVARYTGRGPFPASEHRLGVRTNRLRASLRRNQATISGSSVQGAIGSNVEYAGVHEFGSTASGTATVRAFSRRQASRDVRSPRGPKGGKAKLTASGVALVRSHSRHWRHNIPARAPMQTGIRENLNLYRDLLSSAVVEAMKEGTA